MSGPMSETSRAVVVGSGGIAGAHARAYANDEARIPGRLTAAVDIDKERAATFAEKHNVPRFYVDYDDALEAEGPDVVHICSPPKFHASQAIRAMEAGAHVLCEKPLCASLEELDKIQETEKRTGKSCATVFQWRYGSGMGHLRRQIESGVLGKPLVAVCNTLWYRDEDYYAVPWRGGWETDFGGPNLVQGIHLMDSFLWLMGDWAEVTAKLETLDRDIEVEDVSAAIVKFANGALATVLNSVLSPRQETYLRIDFQRATVEATGLYAVTNADWKWTGVPGTIELGDAGAMKSETAEEAAARAAEEAEWARIGKEIPASHTTLIESFYADVAAGRRPLTSGHEARRTLEFLTALYLSAREGRTVAPGQVKPGSPFYRTLNGHPSQKPNKFKE